MTTQTTSAELMTPGEIRAALNAYDAEMARRASVGAADASAGVSPDGLDGDGLAPARGVCLGALLGALLWCLIVMIWCLIRAAVFAAVGR